MSDGAPSSVVPFALRMVAMSVALACTAGVALVVADADISAVPELRNDLVFRAERVDPPITYRHDDPSAYTQFLPSSVFVHRANSRSMRSNSSWIGGICESRNAMRGRI